MEKDEVTHALYALEGAQLATARSAHAGKLIGERFNPINSSQMRAVLTDKELAFYREASNILAALESSVQAACDKAADEMATLAVEALRQESVNTNL